MKYAFSFNGTGYYEIRESAAYKSEGRFSASDLFKIAIEGTAVRYYRNGTLVYTSATPVPGTLYVDASLGSVGATVQVTALNGTETATTAPPTTTAGLTWTSLVKASASGSLLTKTAGCGQCGDAGAISQQQIGSGGSVSFTVGAGHYLAVGLGRDTSASTNYAFNYAFSFNGTSIYEIRELGYYKTEGRFSASDVFKVAIDGSTVKYYRNGSLVHTSATPAPGAMVVDTTLVSGGASVNVTALTAGSTTTEPVPAPAPAPVPAPTPTTGKLLRVLHWATYHGGFRTDGVYDPDRLANWIVYTQPDVVMLTEIERYTRWGNQNQPEVYKNLLQQKTGKTWYYVFAQEYGDWEANGKGNMILSTYPITYSARYELVHNYDRSIALASITVNNRPLTLMMTHLDPYDATLRLTQAKEVTGWAAPQPEDRILTGDMNAWPDQTSIAHFETLYHDSWNVALANGTATSFAGNTGQTKNGRIDYIYYSRGSTNLFVKSSQVYDTRDANGVMASDHRPLLTVFEVR
jgi:endonuclease/exonuclease/phosphatase family metal-dependent hydrolase